MVPAVSIIERFHGIMATMPTSPASCEYKVNELH